ncbi:MAG: ribonuclease HI [Nitrososphaera sp.]|uniref:Putative ribonuclease H n=1 Tax=Nitrososphaera gargensis (strain Ga9.2) TaxID=1237085 RepID=K0IMU9_NITGG|nr:ribonuclease HI [Candidatus Nitrososphaera gargensis]AFU58254.1 putative ribonuclease H [Candidatus Nitrososphaera gargensis Ga9.2]
MIEVYFDGLCQPINPGGIACYAFVVKSNGKTLHRDYGVAGEPFSKDSTNNIAEYTALAKALEWLVANNLAFDKVEIHSDSQLVVNQLEGNYKVKAKRIVPLYRKVLLLKAKFPDMKIKWVPREQNREADRLTNIAYNKTLRENPEYLNRVLKEEKG